MKWQYDRLRLGTIELELAEAIYEGRSKREHSKVLLKQAMKRMQAELCDPFCEKSGNVLATKPDGELTHYAALRYPSPSPSLANPTRTHHITSRHITSHTFLHDCLSQTAPRTAGRDPPSERQNAADDPLENAEISAAEVELKAAQEKVAQLKAQKDQKKAGKAEAKKKAAEVHRPLPSRTNSPPHPGGQLKSPLR